MQYSLRILFPCFFSCSEFIREVRYLDEFWYLLIHLSRFYEHEK